MKRYPSGFIPVNFTNVGKALLVIGSLLALLKSIDMLFNILNLSYFILIIAIACVGLGAYLRFFVREDK